MKRPRLKKIDVYIGMWGLVLVALSLWFRDVSIFFGTLIGSALAFANWVGYRALMRRVLTSTRRGRFAVLFGLKTIIMFGIVAAIVFSRRVHVLAFIVGLSSLFLGIVTHSIRLALDGGEAVVEEDY